MTLRASRPTVLLFDIDGTLLDTGGAGRRALERAFHHLYGRSDACHGFRFDGMTDRSITRRGLEAVGIQPTEGAIDQLLLEYVKLLHEEVLDADPSRYRVHAGVAQALEATRNPRIAIGLGTGNVREGARVKLERARLFERFAFGGFGCDAEDRIEILRSGARRGAAALGMPLSECRVVVIGDTPKDIAAAQGIGAESVAVATGSYAVDELVKWQPTHVFASLESAGAVLALVGDQ
jgi:phosphoglycolate phosphatase-like HAD superfamily hydrolase